MGMPDFITGSDLEDLYARTILEHARHPANRGRLAGANRRADGENPLCGDRVTVELRIEGHLVREAAFEGDGCALSKGSASMMTLAVQGKTVAEVERLRATFDALVAGRPADAEATQLGELRAFAGVRRFPSRARCALLAWEALKSALDRNDPPPAP